MDDQLSFLNQIAWERWLRENHLTAKGAWLVIAKKGSAARSVEYSEALDVALCYGWIDGIKKGRDNESWLQRFSPRGKRSIWSKINRVHAQRLIKSGKMQAAGLAEVERAKKDGRWDRAYDSQKTSSLPEDFSAALAKSSRAKSFFATIKSHNRYAILFRIQTAKKAETRARKIKEFVAMLAKHETIHPEKK